VNLYFTSGAGFLFDGKLNVIYSDKLTQG